MIMMFWLVVFTCFQPDLVGWWSPMSSPKVVILQIGHRIYSLVDIAMGDSHVKWIPSTQSSFLHGYETLPEGLRCISIVSSASANTKFGEHIPRSCTNFEQSESIWIHENLYGIYGYLTIFFHILSWFLRGFLMFYPSKLGTGPGCQPEDVAAIRGSKNGARGWSAWVGLDSHRHGKW